MSPSISFLLAGVGGQGTILASDVLAEVGIKAGYDAKKAEVHGMAQRGGSVTTHVRWAEKVYSPLAAKGEVDILIAFEKLEALRYIQFLRPGGTVLANDHQIIPITVTSGGVEYPDDATIHALLDKVTDKAIWVKGMAIAEELGNSRVANVVLLGALSQLLDVDPAIWEEVIERRVPARFVDLNREAFRRGRKAATG
jgi:indolepyruvate ferredoxin oxidoreductase beta subunit